MRFIFQYPDHNGPDGDMLDAGPVADVAMAAEAAGWHGLSFTEHPAPTSRWLGAGGHQTLDPFIALGHAAAVTSRLRLLTYLAVGPYRNPLLLAKAAATVDKVSNGRLILGLGTGYLKAEFFALGVDPAERNQLFDEVLDVLPLHWSGETFSYAGTHFDARDVMARPRPVQRPIPIWLGGNADVTLRRVAERAQGWMPLLGPEEFFATVRTAAIATQDQLAARIARLKERAGDRELDIVISWDPASGVGLDELEALGATWIVASTRSSSPTTTLEFIEKFAASYIGSSS